MAPVSVLPVWGGYKAPEDAEAPAIPVARCQGVKLKVRGLGTDTGGWRGPMVERRTLFAAAALVAVLACGAFGYVVVEGYTWAEGLYMAAITVTTVGFGEVRPLSSAGRTFTSVYTLLSFFSVAVLLHSMVKAMLDTVMNGGREGARMKKLIDAMESHYILCGYGRMGKAAAWPFLAARLDIVVIEADPRQCEALRATGIPFIEGDATQEMVLQEAGIQRARGILAMLDSDPENLYIVLTARELNPTLHIIARTEDEGSESRTMRAGADAVVSPFASAGCHVGTSMIESTRAAHHTPIPAAPAGEKPSVSPRKVVIVEDDPVVLQLYTRLFKRGGYHPFAAADGPTALEIIKKERPQAAVIDDALPAMSGREVCRRVRAWEEDRTTGLVLFTTDGSPEARRAGIDAGADEVVVKGVHASTIIQTVNELLGSASSDRSDSAGAKRSSTGALA